MQPLSPRESEYLLLVENRMYDELAPPGRDQAYHLVRYRKYDFERSRRQEGGGQTYGTPEHLLSTAAYLGNLSLVERSLARVWM